MGESFQSAPDGPPPPIPPPVPAGRTVVAVVVSTEGSVVSDVLAPYEVFARSPTFFVYTVAARRVPAPLSGGLHLLPDHDLATAPAPDVVVVPAMVDREAGVLEWISGQAGRGAHILGVCAGSEVLDEAGLLDGRQATSFWANIDRLEGDHPRVTWLRGQRYVEDGPVTTTAGVTSGVVGALRLVERIAGAQEAERIGREVAYPGWALGGPTEIGINALAPADLPYALNAAFPWLRPTLGIGLVDGVGEIDVAAAFEVYSGTSSANRAVAVAASPAITTRHGATLLASTGAAGIDRLVVPGTGDADAGLAAWASDRGLPIERPHATRAPGEFSFDPVLRDLATSADVATARATAKFVEYPIDGSPLSGAAWPVRPTALLALTLVVAAIPLIAAWPRRVSAAARSQPAADRG
jgi:putative intracellular protease/amidase